ncbi:MAG: four helix bundle protein [Gemmatimonadaceae bacterium]
MRVRSHRDLRIWQKAIELARESYLLTNRFPREEAFGLTAQIKRSASSVPFNIAEGNGRLYRRDYLRFLAIANGSLSELDSQLELARQLGYADPAAFERVFELHNHVGRMLTLLMRRLRESE